MAAAHLLDAALNGTAIPHQPYVVVSDRETFGAVPVLREMVRRSCQRSSPVLLVTVIRSPAVYLGASSDAGTASSPKLAILDLTDRIPGYSTTSDIVPLRAEILDAAEKLGSAVEIYIDGIDVLAEDYTAAGALNLVRALLKMIKANKAPSRLILSCSPHSALFPSLLPPSLSASLTVLHPHPPELLSSLSTAYLALIGASHRFLDLLDTASERRKGERMAVLGETSLGDWARSHAGPTGGKGKAKVGDPGAEGVGVAAVQITVRKATGGAKGISRSLEGLAVVSQDHTSASIASSASRLSMPSTSKSDLRVVPLESILDLTPFSRSSATAAAAAAAAAAATSNGTGPSLDAQKDTHSALNLPFSLSLTDEQRRRRDVVPIPYVHEGEGVELGWEEEEDDEDDEEI